MTTLQWLFHYHEVSKYKEVKDDFTLNLIKEIMSAVDDRFKILLENIYDANKLSGGMSNPEALKAILDTEKLKELKAEIGDDEFSDWWDEFSTRIPHQLQVEAQGDNVDIEGEPGIDLEKLYEIDIAARKEQYKKAGD